MGSIAAAPLAVVRLAILECDTPRPMARSRYGSYGGMFERILRTDKQSLLLSDEHAGTIQVSKWQIDCDEAEYPDLDAIDALLITGSSEWPRVQLCLDLVNEADRAILTEYSAYQNIPWISRLITYTQKALDTERVKIIGTCFGHQILGMALHAHVGPNPCGWGLAVLPVELSTTGRALFKRGGLVSILCEREASPHAPMANARTLRYLEPPILAPRCRL